MKIEYLAFLFMVKVDETLDSREKGALMLKKGVNDIQFV